MRSVLLGLLIIVWAGLVHAQEIDVRTGDHDRFTRVVLNLPTSADWRIGRIDGGYAIEIDGSGTFDTSRFYDLIPRDRIANFTTQSEPLRLNLGISCDCFVSAELERSGWLVVDVIDGEAPPDAAFEAPIDPVVAGPVVGPDLVIGLLDQNRAVTESAQQGAAISASLPPPLPDGPQRPFALPAGSRPQERPLMDTVRLSQIVDQSAEVSALEAAVANSLNRALNQGLVEIAPNAERSVASDAADGTLEQLLQDVSEIHTPGITVTTSIDTARQLPVGMAPEPTPNVNCLPDALFMVGDWGGDGSFATQIGMLRTAVTGEFDLTDQAAVEDLARGYLYFGFGREAIQALKIDGIQSRERSVIQALGAILDGDPVSIPNFSRQMGCEGAAALWGLLAHRDGPFPTSVDVALVTRSFKLLPAHLQLHLGPRLSSKLRQYGSFSEAGIVLSGISDAADAGAEVVLAQTEQAVADGDLEAAAAELQAFATQDTRRSPETLLQVIALAIANDEPVSIEDIALLDILAFERDGRPEAVEIADARVRAMIHNEAYTGAIKALETAQPLVDDARYLALSDQVMRAIISGADDVTFLDTVFEERAATDDADLHNRIALRLVGLGFPQRAADFVSDQAVGATMSERRYVRAAIAMAQRDPDRAAAHLAGVNTDRAKAILRGDGADSESTQIDPSVSAWRSGNWEQLADADDDLLRDVSQRVLQTPEALDLTAAPLAEGSTLIADSEALRSSVTELMRRFPAPEIADNGS